MGDIFFQRRGARREAQRFAEGELEVVGYAFNAFFEVEDVKVEEKT